ncbi:MAG: N4-gp56 family major capsid protein [Chloroflexi bacterium]|nr:MAG: N4-gp56 family major capsid protein [Chloroflexota bacterium]
MANTVSIDALRPEIWQKELYKDREDNLFFANKQMMGTSENSLVQVKDQLVKSKGDQVTFGLTTKLDDSAAITGDNEAEGNETAISSYAEAVAIDQVRFPVRLTGSLDEQKAAYDMRSDAKNKIGIATREFLERQIFMKLGGVTETDLTDVAGSVYSSQAAWSNTAPIVPAADEAAGTGNRYVCADAAGIDSLEATDILTLSLITRAKIKAQLASPRMQPIRVDGQDWYVMFIHPWQEYDLKAASTGNNWSQIQRDAQVRGDRNPIFRGALGAYDGVILHSHEYVPTCQASSDFSSGGTDAAVRCFRALLCGAQAAVMAETKKSMMMVEETFDYKNKVGYAAGFIGGIQKPAFNSLDYSVIAVDTGATDLS